jgi:hypothetical protein
MPTLWGGWVRHLGWAGVLARCRATDLPAWCREAAFNVAVAAWLVFEFVMRVRQRLRAGGPAVWGPSAFVLVPCLVAAVIAAGVLGRNGRLPWPGGLVWPVVAGVVLIAAA